MMNDTFGLLIIKICNENTIDIRGWNGFYYKQLGMNWKILHANFFRKMLGERMIYFPT